jgi:hypothetical protein
LCARRAQPTHSPRRAESNLREIGARALSRAAALSSTLRDIALDRTQAQCAAAPCPHGPAAAGPRKAFCETFVAWLSSRAAGGALPELSPVFERPRLLDEVDASTALRLPLDPSASNADVLAAVRRCASERAVVSAEVTQVPSSATAPMHAGGRVSHDLGSLDVSLSQGSENSLASAVDVAAFACGTSVAAASVSARGGVLTLAREMTTHPAALTNWLPGQMSR